MTEKIKKIFNNSVIPVLVVSTALALNGCGDKKESSQNNGMPPGKHAGVRG